MTVPDPNFVAEHAPGGRTLSFTRSPLVLLAIAGYRYGRVLTRLLQGRHGESVMVWRLLVLLARHPGAAVSTASQTTGIDKAAVSRAFARMERDGLIRAEAQQADPRRRTWTLTAAGAALHARMLPSSLELHDTLLDGFTAEDIAQLQGLLGRMIANLEQAEREAPAQTPDAP